MNLSNRKRKTNKWKIPLYKVFTDEYDIKQISNVLKRGMDWAIGPEIEKFEKKIVNYIGTKYCITFKIMKYSIICQLL